MQEAFERLPAIQQRFINRPLFEKAYSCVAVSKGNDNALIQIIREEVADCPHLEPDLLRYCKLVKRVM